MAKGKNMKKKNKQQPVSQESFRAVVETDTWCSFKKRNENSKAPYGYLVAVSTRKEFNTLPEDVARGYIVRSKLIGGTFYVQVIPKEYFYGPEPEYAVHTFMEIISKKRRRRIFNVLNESRPKRRPRG